MDNLPKTQIAQSGQISLLFGMPTPEGGDGRSQRRGGTPHNERYRDLPEFTSEKEEGDTFENEWEMATGLPRVWSGEPSSQPPVH